MSLSASRISSPKGFPKAMIQTEQILLVVDRHDIRLESDRLVLVKPPLKMYGITAPRTISFTFSTVDEIPDGVLKAHIGITASTPILQRIVLRMDQCFFTDIELPIGGRVIPEGSAEIRKNLLNPESKDDYELDRYPYSRGGYKLEPEDLDLKILIDTTLIQVGVAKAERWMIYTMLHKKDYAKEQKKKEKKKNFLRIITFRKPLKSNLTQKIQFS